jgi:hypothetical protein
MSILNKLASSLDRRDEKPNQELAKQLSKSGDKKAIKELVDNLSNKDKNIQSDCIKVLYEIGEQKAELIADYDKEFLTLLENKNNRLIWGAMTALDCIAGINPKSIYKNLNKILDASDKGSVITKDHGVSILIKLAAIKTYADNALTLLLAEFKTCPTNQLPMYAENAIPVIGDKYKKDFIKVLTSRLGDIEKDTKKKRVEKVIKKLSLN